MSRLTEPMPSSLVRERGAPARWLIFVSDNLALTIGIALLSVIIFIAVFAPLLATADPLKVMISARLRPLSAAHWFGTDALGRDLYARVIYGARVSLIVGASVAVMTTLLGAMIGLLAGFIRRADAPLMRIMDGAMSIPPVLLAIALMALLGPSVQNVIAAITLADVPRMARLVRGVSLTLRDLPFVEAARLSGSSTAAIIVRHILPNATAPIVVQATYVFASAVLVEAVLSFLGAGTPSGLPSWGNIIAEARALWQAQPHLIFIPAAFLSFTVLAVNLVGDGIRDLLDPRFEKAVQR